MLYRVLIYIDKYASTAINIKSGAQLVKKVAENISLDKENWTVSCNGKEYSFDVTRSSVSAGSDKNIIQWMISGNGGVFYAVTNNIEEAVTQYLSDLKVLGQETIKNCRKQIFSVKNGIELISLTGLQTLYDELGKDVITSALAKVNLDGVYDKVTTLTLS